MDDYLHFIVEQHLLPMMSIAEDLGDSLVNVTPELPGANSAYQIVFHTCGMLEWWSREAILGQPVGRDRDAEFVATGTVQQLLGRVEQVVRQFTADLPAIDPKAPLRGDPGEDRGTPIGTSAGGVLLHILEEVAQHHGQLELTRDLLRAGLSPPASAPAPAPPGSRSR